MNQQYNTDSNGKNTRFALSRKLYIFIVCFILSSFIWIIIKMSKDYAETAVFPVMFSNFPSGKVVVNDPDSVLTIQLKTKGFRIISNLLFGKPQTIYINVGSIVKKIKNSNTNYYILTSELNQFIGSQIHYPNDIVEIKPDTLHFVIEKKFSKRVAVKAMLNLSYAQQFELADSVMLDPENVIVSGPLAVIDTLKFVETVSKRVSNISESQNYMLDIASKYKKAKLTFAPSSVKAKVPVEKYTEAWVDLNISIINNPNNYLVRTFPDKTRVTYLVSLTKYKEIESAMFTAVADLSKSLDAKSKKMKVEIIKYPASVRIRKTEPEKIEFIILK